MGCTCQVKPVACCRNEAGFAPRGKAGHRHPGFGDAQTKPPYTAVSRRRMGTSLESRSPANEAQASPCELGGSGIRSRGGGVSCPAGDTWGFSLEDAQHLQLLDQPTEEPSLQDPTLIHLRGIEPLLYPVTSSLHRVAPCMLSEQHQLDAKPQPALNRRKTQHSSESQ